MKYLIIFLLFLGIALFATENSNANDIQTEMVCNIDVDVGVNVVPEIATIKTFGEYRQELFFIGFYTTIYQGSDIYRTRHNTQPSEINVKFKAYHEAFSNPGKLINENSIIDKLQLSFAVQEGRYLWSYGLRSTELLKNSKRFNISFYTAKIYQRYIKERYINNSI